MTITVVTARDENGVPSTREVLRGGDTYTIISGNLEIISSAREALGFYASGNWLSVYVGDCVAVNPDGSEPEPGGGFGGPPDADVAPVVSASDSQAAEATEPALQVTEPTLGEDVAEDGEILVRPEPDTHRPPRVGGFGSTAETTGPPGMRPVVFRAKAYKPKDSDPDPPPPNGRMRPVVFQAKAYKPKDSDPDPPPPNRRMRPVVFQAKAYKPKDSDPDPPPPNRRMRPVIIRPRTHAPQRDDPSTPSPDH